MKELAYLFPVFFAGMFVFVIFVLARKGWSDLAMRYECESPFDGNRFGIISASVNGVNYNNCLLLKYNEQGFYLRPIFIFRLFHKGVFIPWQEIKDVRDKNLMFIKIKELVIGAPVVSIVQIKDSTFKKLEQKTLLGTFIRR